MVAVPGVSLGCKHLSMQAARPEKGRIASTAMRPFLQETGRQWLEGLLRLRRRRPVGRPAARAIPTRTSDPAAMPRKGEVHAVHQGAVPIGGGGVGAHGGHDPHKHRRADGPGNGAEGGQQGGGIRQLGRRDGAGAPVSRASSGCRWPGCAPRCTATRGVWLVRKEHLIAHCRAKAPGMKRLRIPTRS